MQRIKQNPFQFVLFVLIMMAIFSCDMDNIAPIDNIDCEIDLIELKVSTPDPIQGLVSSIPVQNFTNDLEVREFRVNQIDGEGNVNMYLSSVGEELMDRFRVVVYVPSTDTYLFDRFYRSKGNPEGSTYNFFAGDLPVETRMFFFLFKAEANKPSVYLGGRVVTLAPVD